MKKIKHSKPTEDTLTSLFFINQEQLLTLAKFETSHLKCCKGVSGGHLTYCFTPTSIGLIVKIECACGKIEDITDYEKW